MKFDIVRQPLIATFLMLLTCAIVAMGRTYGMLGSVEVAADAPSLLGEYLRQWQDASPIWARVVSCVLIFYAGWGLGRMAVRHNFYATHTYLPISLYGILACGLFVSDGFLVEYLASALLVASVKNYCACFRNGSYGFGPIFRGSLYLGLIPLFYTPALLLVVVVPMVVFVFKRTARELVVAVVGLLLPFSALSYLNWAFGGDFLISAQVLWHNFLSGDGFPLFSLDMQELIFVGVTIVLLFCAVLCNFADAHSSGLKSRTMLFFHFLLLLLTFAMCLLPCASVATAAVMAVPAALILPQLFIHIDRRIALLLFLSIAGLAVFCIWR